MTVDIATDEDRQLLRENVRRFLERQWPAERALSLAADPERVSSIWKGLGQQGLAALGTDPAEGGLREILIVLEELGRAGCPAPMWGTALANIALWPRRTAWAQAASLLGDLHHGKATVSVGLGPFDGDRNAGRVTIANGALSGKLAFLEGASSATHLLVLAEPGPVIAMVCPDAVGMKLIPTPGHAVPPLAEVSFENTPANAREISLELAEDLSRIARLAMIARSLGAANRVFELALDYAKVRRQFGQPIGRFQAIQHKLADCLISLQGTRLTLDNAASSFDRGSADWRIFASAAFAFASPAIRQVSLEAHHVFCAIGYAEEHEAPRHFRRAHSDLVRHGGMTRSHKELAEYLLDGAGAGKLPDYDLGPAANAFRTEVRDWLNQNWNEERRAKSRRLPFADRFKDREFGRQLGEKGWIGVAWPKKFGGQERTTFEQLAYIEELSGAGAPAHGISFQAQALIKYGSPEQQAKFLPAILRGEIFFCLGYSEPESGSDLASLRTRAVREGDQWVINGQKVWTTGGDWMDYVWLAARTNPDAKPKHAGISMFIVPMNTPGITVRPSMAMYGRTFCTVFYDNVRVPLNALVGKVDGGWEILTLALADERIALGGVVARVRSVFAHLVEYIRSTRIDGRALKDDETVRERVGRLAAELEVARQLLMHSLRMVEKGGVPVAEAAMSKVYSGELMERLGEAALDIVGMTATLSEGSSGAILHGELDQLLRHSIMYVVGGGTAQIQRNLIAQRGLGLPR